MTGTPRVKKAPPPPVYRWTVDDHRMGRKTKGEAPSRARAEADVITELRRIGRSLNGVSATVFRPNGGGWFCRVEAHGRGFSWEEWEPLDV